MTSRAIAGACSRAVVRRRGARAPFDAFAAQLYAAAFFGRALTSWSGACLVARRSSDNAEQDIGFTANGSLDTAALLAFAGSGSAYLVRHYDQTGQGHDIVQATTASQFRLVNAGVLDTTLSGKPVGVASGSQRMAVENALGFSRNASAITVACLASITNVASSPYIFMSSTPGGGTRAFMSAPSSGAVSIGGRRLDANGAQSVAQPYAGGFARLIGRLRYSEALADITVDGATNSSAFQTAGQSSDTDSSAAPSIFSYTDGNFRVSGLYGGVALARSALGISAVDGALSVLMA